MTLDLGEGEEVIVTCSFAQVRVEGKGDTEREARQRAAAAMLNKIEKIENILNDESYLSLSAVQGNSEPSGGEQEESPSKKVKLNPQQQITKTGTLQRGQQIASNSEQPGVSYIDLVEEGIEEVLAEVTCCRLKGGLRELWSSGAAPWSMLRAETWDLYQFSR